jgi:glycosyltransferase involved in cell wall biosynthesis
MGKKVCLLSDHHLCINPRLWKEAFFYEKEGFEVVVLSMWQSDDLLQKDFEILKGHTIIYKAYVNLIPGQAYAAKRFFYRARKKLASEAQRWFGIGTAWSISYAPGDMIKGAIKENADFYAAHLECAFYAGRELIRSGKKVSFDFEDWYSRDYLTADRAVNLLSKLEKFALHNGTFCTAASQSMANALVNTYHAKKKPVIIYNSFPEEEGHSFDLSLNQNPLKVIWTSRTAGPGRGLEDFIEALKDFKYPVELHIIGKPVEGYEESLTSQLPAVYGHRILFHDFIRHKDLLAKIATYNLGLALEYKTPDNKNKTVSNKILQYLQAGIKVIATDTDGQKEVAGFFPQSVFLVEAGKPKQWKEQLEKMIDTDKNNIKEQKKIYNNFFSWAKQEEKLKELITKNL